MNNVKKMEKRTAPCKISRKATLIKQQIKEASGFIKASLNGSIRQVILECSWFERLRPSSDVVLLPWELKCNLVRL